MRVSLFVSAVLFAGIFPASALVAQPAVELRSIYARNTTVGRLLARNERASVFLFVKPACPAVDLSIPHLRELAERYAPRGIGFYAIYSNAGLNIREMARHMQQRNFPVRAFLDVDQRLARQWAVNRTAMAVVVNRAGEVLYKGAILDGERANRDEGRFLRDALEDVVGGARVRVAETAGQGCVINTRTPALPRGLTFYRDILPILQQKCQRCHRPGEVAPMSLLTYDDVWNNGAMIDQVVEDRTMPPWPGESPHAIRESAGLTDEQVRQIRGWIREDMPEGERNQAPRAVTWPDPQRWQIGEPTEVFRSREYTVPETGIVPYIYTRHPIRAAADQDVFLEALEVRPGSRRAVHHMAIHEFPYSEQPLTAADLLRIYGLEISNTILGAYVPGIQPRIMPPGHAIRIRRGMGVLIDAHYTPFGERVSDVTQVGFRIRRTPPEREVFSQWFYRSRGRFRIPPGADHVSMVRDDISFDRDIEILGLRPHLHARGKSFLVEKFNFRGAERAETLLAVPRWDFNWQYDYMLETPLRVSGGEALRITAAWDNTDLNPTNPDPRAEALFGEQTQDEMMGVLLIWRNALPNGANR